MQERKDALDKQLDDFMTETKELQDEFIQAQTMMQGSISQLTADLEDTTRRFEGRESRKVGSEHSVIMQTVRACLLEQRNSI